MWFCRVVLRRLGRGGLVEGLCVRREGGGVAECILYSFWVAISLCRDGRYVAVLDQRRQYCG